MERLQEARNEIDERLLEAEGEVHKLQLKLAKQEKLMQEEKDAMARLQDDLMKEKNKVHRLQTELNTNEQVQQDFVRLSQTLQVSMEQIRQAESLEQVKSILDGARPETHHNL
ncbi:rab GTPase-binding effector protein 2-like [Ambystoma mexicanum]|uniref:rab GTPase-binding effector protein 2-like n=1 Tax=Ambystoma mexicanum TaxID=8296 RepID=UPI0037E828E5